MDFNVKNKIQLFAISAIHNDKKAYIHVLLLFNPGIPAELRIDFVGLYENKSNIHQQDTAYF